MRICYLSDINSAHTQKWCRYFLDKGYDVHVISLRRGEYPGVKVYSLEVDESVAKIEKSSGKLRYLNTIKKVKSIVNDIKPDILHAHYASSYGLIGALCNYHPYIISLWGSDILLFPKEGIIQKLIIKYNLKKADNIFSTSKYMADEALKYTNKNIEITPFGIDLEIFKNNNTRSNSEIKIGIVKSLEKVYGIEYLIKAFKILVNKYPEHNLYLQILGDGTQSENLLQIVNDLSLQDRVEFLKPTDLKGVSDFYNKIHIGVFPSISESFGVAVLEAQACGVPVVVSDIPAFKETTILEETSIICKSEDVDSIVEGIEKLLLDKDNYKLMSIKSEQFARENFDIKKIFNNIESLYENIIKN